jgi:hypothetical protein
MYDKYYFLLQALRGSNKATKKEAEEDGEEQPHGIDPWHPISLDQNAE